MQVTLKRAEFKNFTRQTLIIGGSTIWISREFKNHSYTTSLNIKSCSLCGMKFDYSITMNTGDTYKYCCQVV